MSLGARIAEYRRHLGLSQAEAARRAGVTRNTWRAWETDAKTPDDRNHKLIEDFCEWEPGSVADVLDRRAPTPMHRASVIPLYPGVAHSPPHEDALVEDLRVELRAMKLPDALVEELIAEYLSERRDDDTRRHRRYLGIARAARR